MQLPDVPFSCLRLKEKELLPNKASAEDHGDAHELLCGGTLKGHEGCTPNKPNGNRPISVSLHIQRSIFVINVMAMGDTSRGLNP